jgi:hypothetical protein
MVEVPSSACTIKMVAVQRVTNHDRLCLQCAYCSEEKQSERRAVSASVRESEGDIGYRNMEFVRAQRIEMSKSLLPRKSFNTSRPP